MRIGNTRFYNVYNYSTRRNDEGRIIKGFSDVPFAIKGYVYNLSGTVNAQMYGDRLPYMYRMLSNDEYHEVIENGVIKFTNGINTFGANDGICIFSNDKPDFKVISITRHDHLIIDMEVIQNG